MRIHPQRLPVCSKLCAAAAALLAGGAACAGDAGSGFSAGIEVRPQALVADVGLPVFPGAVRRVDRDGDEGDDSDSATVALWGGGLGFKLVAIRYASTAPLGQVAAFYRAALARDGSLLLDCSAPSSPGRPARRDDGALQCDETPSAGQLVYKAGTGLHHRQVTLRQVGDRVHFEVVRIDIEDGSASARR